MQKSENQLSVSYLPNLNVYIGKNLQQSKFRIYFEGSEIIMQIVTLFA